MKKPLTVQLADVQQLAQTLAPTLRGGEILALIGDLGSGKTTFTRALAKRLKVRDVVTSPTFILMNRYAAQTTNRSKIHLYHLDLYRLKNFREAKALGLTEIWQDPKTITVIEWADKIKKHLPPSSIIINFVT